MNPDSLADQYRSEGYAIVHQAIDANLLGEAQAHLDWLAGKHPGIRGENLHHELVKNDPFWLRLVSDDRLLDIAEALLGPDIALFASHYIAKPPRDGRPVLWHQDGSYWPLEPMDVISVWLATDDSTPENGCMRVIPGTQAVPLQKMESDTSGGNVLGSRIDPSLVDESKAVDVVLKAGDVSVHHPNIIHGSEANMSDKRRGGLTIRYIPTTTRIAGGRSWPCAFLLRGRAVPGVNEYQPRSKYVAGEHFAFRGSEAWA